MVGAKVVKLYLFLCDESNNSCCLSWNSTRMKRVVRSTLAAETLSIVDRCETALYFLDVVRSISMSGEDSCPDVINITDNKSLFNAVHSTKLTLDRRLRLDISAVREMCEREQVCLQWVETRGQLSGVLTKRVFQVLQVLHSLLLSRTEKFNNFELKSIALCL